MKIIKNNPANLSTEDKFRLTMSPETQKMKSAVGSALEIQAWCLYEDENKDGDMQQILSILTPEGETFATNSATFIRDFGRIVDLYDSADEQLEAVRVITGTSKAGREFITCTLR